MRRGFEIKTEIDWDALQTIALKRTFLEKIWDRANAMNDNQLVLYLILSVFLSPAMLLLVYKWASIKLPTNDISDMVTVFSVIGSVIVIAAMLIGSVFFIVIRRIPNDSISSGPFFQKFQINFAMTFGILVVVSMGSMYHFAKFSEGSGHVSIRVQDNEKLVDKSFAKLAMTNVSSLSANLETGSLLEKDPEYYNALAVSFERQGRLLDAQKAYIIAEKSDPFHTSLSYILNNKPNEKELSRWKSNIDAGSLILIDFNGEERFIRADLYNLFQSREQLLAMVDSIMTEDDCMPSCIDQYNARAVAYEYLGKEKEAEELYGLMLEEERYNPTVLFNIQQSLSSEIKGNKVPF